MHAHIHSLPAFCFLLKKKIHFIRDSFHLLIGIHKNSLLSSVIPSCQPYVHSISHVMHLMWHDLPHTLKHSELLFLFLNHNVLIVVCFINRKVSFLVNLSESTCGVQFRDILTLYVHAVSGYLVYAPVTLNFKHSDHLSERLHPN